MAKQKLLLPKEAFRLEECNLPPELAGSIAGHVVAVDLLPEEQACTRLAGPGEGPCLIDRDGKCWNVYRPVQIAWTDVSGRQWHFPRGWLLPTSDLARPDATYSVTRPIQFTEQVHLPSYWDLVEINLPALI